MRIKLIRHSELTTKEWSGGTTTELLIYPEVADYARRDFIWRVSTARVEDEESEFTVLEGVDRILMVLEGELWLNHEGLAGEIFMQRFGQTRFDGGAATSSRGGGVTDFNLMMKGADGRVEALSVMPGGKVMVNTHGSDSDYDFRADIFYDLSGADLAIGGHNYSLEKGDVICLETERNDEPSSDIEIKAVSAEAEVIHAVVLYNSPAS